MTENIELDSFLSKNTNENYIQEYQEIKEDTGFDESETTFTPKHESKSVNQYDFFTQFEVKTDQKKTLKKKFKKKNKSPNLMDIINSELAANTIPIKENVISLVDKEKHCSYLEPIERKVFRKQKFVFSDTEHGWPQNSHVLSPIFPRVLENIAIEDHSIPVEYVDPTLFEDLVNQNVENGKDVTTKFLDITIKNIKFKHHHLFSLEKLLCLKLVEYYNKYEYTQKLLTDTINDVKVNRKTKDNLTVNLTKVSPKKTENIVFDPIVRKYTEKMLQLKDTYRGLIKDKKEIIHNIQSIWSDIELVREKHGRKDTALDLKINKVVLDEKDFEKEWNTTFNEEFTDMLVKIEFDYVNEYLEYKEAKHEKTPKPLKPKLEIHENAIKEEVEHFVNDIVTRDKIELYLKKDTKLDSRKDQRSFKIDFYFEIYMDDIFVCESEHYITNEMFTMEFTEGLSVQILPSNSNLKIIMLENDRRVSNLVINLQNIKNTNSGSDYVVENLFYNDIIEPTFQLVGSGYSIKDIALSNKVRLKSSSLFKEKMQTNCEVNVKVGWNDNLEQNQIEAIKSSMEVGRTIKRLLHGIDKPAFDTLLNVISKLYEKDINDVNMIEALRNLSNMEIKRDDIFPEDENHPDLVRLKLLHLRNVGQFTNIQNKTVPLYASQISTEQLDCLQNTKEKEFNMDYLSVKETEMDPIELQRFIGAKYVQKLNKNMLKNLNEYLLKKTHKDVVRDFDLSLRSLFSNQSNLITIATMSNSMKEKMLNEGLNKEQEIQVTVIRAFNLLDRSSTVLEEDERHDGGDNIAGYRLRPLRPFVRLNYRGATAQTVTAIGCHPTWSHTLKLKTTLEPLSTLQINIFDEYITDIAEGYSKDEDTNKTAHYRYYNKWLGTLQVPLHAVLSLGTLRGTFKISTPSFLFGYETLQAKELASLIPEITQLMKKETSYITLQITTSLSNLGGLHAYHQPLPSSIEDDYLIKHLNNFVTEYTNEFPTRTISLTFIDSAGRNKCVTQYLQPIPLPEKDFLPKNPRESALSKSSGYSKSSSSSGRRRELDVERVSQEEKESVYSVYDPDNMSKMINACMRYVSLIPSYEVKESHVVTLMGLELLKVLHGTPLDHTILLASYFIYLGIKCWVVMGSGIPRGLSSYVLIKHDLTTRRIVLENDQLFRKRGFLNKNDGYTWYVCDAMNGERYELRDVGCPLKTVDYVFDNENIWVNVQTSQECENLSFDFSRSSDWQPVFDKNVFVMKQPVVTDISLYSSPSNVEGLRATIDTKVRAKIQKWRSHMKTIWNRYCSSLLRDTLPQWEFWAFNQSRLKPALTQKLKQLMITYKIYGFPLNMPYLNMKSLISAVKSTGLHATDDPNVEFALGVEVFAYPNKVISVWLFLASITRV